MDLMPRDQLLEKATRAKVYYYILDNGQHPIYTLEERAPGTIKYPIDRYQIDRVFYDKLGQHIIENMYTDLYEAIDVVRKLNDEWRATLPQETV